MKKKHRTNCRLSCICHFAAIYILLNTSRACGGVQPAVQSDSDRFSPLIGTATEVPAGFEDSNGYIQDDTTQASSIVWNDELTMVRSADTERSEHILNKQFLTVSYNKDTKCPNYVSWKINSVRLEKNVERTDFFQPDTEVEESLRIIHSDYSRTGYDRGHMCPAADNRFCQAAMEESFLMTNICPQSHTLNAGDWNDLEELCRKWAEEVEDVYVVCGPIFSKDTKKIGKRKKCRISVPDRFFKVVLLKDGDKYQSVGFVMNNNDEKHPLAHYAVSVDTIEEITGFDFFHNLPDSIENEVEQHEVML